jgi:hypothetical protein
MGDLENGLRGEMNERFDKVDAKFDKVDSRFNTLDAKFDRKFDWLTGGIVASTITILAAVIGPNVL